MKQNLVLQNNPCIYTLLRKQACNQDLKQKHNVPVTLQHKGTQARKSTPKLAELSSQITNYTPCTRVHLYHWHRGEFSRWWQKLCEPISIDVVWSVNSRQHITHKHTHSMKQQGLAQKCSFALRPQGGNNNPATHSRIWNSCHSLYIAVLEIKTRVRYSQGSSCTQHQSTNACIHHVPFLHWEIVPLKTQTCTRYCSHVEKCSFHQTNKKEKKGYRRSWKGNQ